MAVYKHKKTGKILKSTNVLHREEEHIEAQVREGSFSDLQEKESLIWAVKSNPEILTDDYYKDIVK